MVFCCSNDLARTLEVRSPEESPEHLRTFAESSTGSTGCPGMLPRKLKRKCARNLYPRRQNYLDPLVGLHSLIQPFMPCMVTVSWQPAHKLLEALKVFERRCSFSTSKFFPAQVVRPAFFCHLPGGSPK